jgi:tetratricopeptide (TPR) repeat protein
MKKLIQAEKITEAEKEIAEAKRLHPKYPPVIEAEKILKDGKDKKANKDAALAKERTNRDAADRLWNEGTALYNQKKMGEALIKFKESLKSLGTPERVKFVQDLEAGFAKDKANKDAADKLWNEGTALYNQKKMGEALVKFKESLKSLGTPERIKYVQDLEAGLAKDKAAKDAILAKDKANKDAADKLWNEGAALYNQKKMGEALIKFKESIKSLSTPEKVKYVQDLEAKTGQTKIQCQRLNDEGAQLQASGKFKESLIKYTDYQKLCPSPEIENHIKQIQAKIKESEEKEGKKVIAKKLRDEATVLQQQNRLKEAIARYRESLTYLPDPDLEKHVKQLEIKAATPASAQIPAASSVNTPRPVDKTPPKSKVIFENGNTGSVQNNPNCNPAFSITAPHRITLIWNYHWNNGKGVPAGTISLKKQDGTVYGPWQTSTGTGQSNAPNVNWTASPNITIPAGTYTVIDSNPNTWSQNSQSKGCGFTKVEGFVN